MEHSEASSIRNFISLCGCREAITGNLILGFQFGVNSSVNIVYSCFLGLYSMLATNIALAFYHWVHGLFSPKWRTAKNAEKN
jgi:hypothetical protein